MGKTRLPKPEEVAKVEFVVLAIVMVLAVVGVVMTVVARFGLESLGDGSRQGSCK